ncbi:TPA: hypothetical protein MJE31_26925 [Klebsiella pneumoniae]|uniref:hypothetical protein n=1 Tax=Klebsiella pneumoniae complex TaxID=3390273 RepID=UPI0007CBE6B7|nr:MULTISPECIES: hypothetical protein [Klebsiella]ELC0798990.1 hypothetical protein [Klebsiella pneumoniae]ELH4123780.1 hypothetical protein [Klebsiella pneumoniae]TNJ79444.1 hypothetical protein CI665_014100 [Klebsiella quasipneumoniae subsp. similipneumoniae]SBH77643.1 Uncharacterised protein [Klebsiella variicola]HBR5672056.1 hypothetical protein [Klebsiella pneumoniae]
MTTFAVISDQDNEKLLSRIGEIFPSEDVIKVDSRLILVSSEEDAVAKQITVKIESNGVRLKEYGRVVVFSITSYQGYHYKKMWEWLQGKFN